MTSDQELISRYLDDELREDDRYELNQRVKTSPQFASALAQAVLLHDRLRGELQAQAFSTATTTSEVISPRETRAASSFVGRGAWAVALSLMVLASFVAAVTWLGSSQGELAASQEVDRLIAAQQQSPDRTYQITVEQIAPDSNFPNGDDGRPPKPPLDQARLYVRRGHQFVLVRPLPDGEAFITGSNGLESWAVRPSGPVRVSDDLTRFQHDLPGHEHQMPLINIEEGMQRLLAAYEVEFQSVESTEDQAEPMRRLIAKRKPGNRGPEQVEITYAEQSRLIHEMRFTEMPYGPQRLTIRLTLLEQQDLGPKFFAHPSHHQPDRPVERE
ncbi:hypothetical protein [Blastopirellula marina]|uniref:Uncharacterized protein n=1 Tax=Blastopirellula marina TaxID=124 RepID=A0A2S8FLH3_9BACT|nr:hypothetical protein [Blastopirellula marina]PQO33013.1 hypothetical protein C5Y98_17915 [Blastopirellula marina]PTL43180.1 hypothetical protein C5Y97_17925 [Blastopirellula marina]